MNASQEPLPLPPYGPTVNESAFAPLLSSGSIAGIVLVFEEEDPRCSIQFKLADQLISYLVDDSGDVRLFEISDALRFLKSHKIDAVEVDLSTSEP